MSRKKRAWEKINIHTSTAHSYAYTHGSGLAVMRLPLLHVP